MVLGRQYLPQRFLLLRVRESRRSAIVESEYCGGLFGFVCDVGNLVRMDSRDFLDKREGIGDRDSFCVVKNVCPPFIASLAELTVLGQPRAPFLAAA